ncbi:hypothetical protein M501DRAFT_588341 [Patellaria atrata CBS 101060]|uniref:Clustered mitochondria protein homolog n=1 Tax=Patellaria atrata CBS 101060 TaxID=1346257 RepID=A0A9P4S155_9PEZI|nr:hypothetical protein M501DRAFT_588341 [Patellaria atrata CBS 101060]
MFTLSIRLPQEPYTTQIMASSQEQVQDIRASLIEFPYTFQYTCFHLEYKEERINDYVELSEVPGIGPDSELTLVEDPYTEKDARLHFIRIRELIGASGDRTDTIYGIQAGVSLHDSVALSDATQAIANYDFEGPGSVRTLLAPSEDSSPKTLKSISLSPWNPPPYNLRSKGHLLYLQLTTNEGEQYQITSHVSGFYVNKCTNSKFDPSPRQAPKAFSSHSLLNLISSLSPSFEASFSALQELGSKKDALATFQLTHSIPASPWIVPPPSAANMNHQSDIARSQESFLISGAESADTLRDWNEELQSTRELPKELVQDRVFRERLTAKLYAEYNEAATRGAVLVARGEVPPLNPTEGRDAQIFVYNNVFYSFGADGVGTFGPEGGDEAARVATGKDVVGVKAVNQLDIQGLFTPGTVIADYLGKRIVAQSIVPGIFKQREPGENQIDYGGAEGRDVIADNETFVPVFEQLSKHMRVKKHPVWDKQGKRHVLEGSIETKGLLGTDGRKYALDLYRITPLDVSWLEQYWSEPPKEGEGESKDKDKDYPHRMAVLRPELVEAYGRVKLRKFLNSELSKRPSEAGEGEKQGEEEMNGESASQAKPESESDEAGRKADETTPPKTVDIGGFQFALNPDVFCGHEPQTDEEKEEWSKDEEEVRAACKYLSSEVIPRFIQDLREGDIGFPLDGQSLSNLLHKRGINIRYLGVITTQVDTKEPRLQPLRRLAIQEMISRGFKHVANRYLRHLPHVFATSCVAHLLNCLLGAALNPKPTAETDASLKDLYSDTDFSFEKATPASLREELAGQVRIRFRYDLGEDWIQPIQQLPLLREVSLRLGLQLEAKDYVFSKEISGSGSDTASVSSDTTPVPTTVNGQANGTSKKNKKKKNRSPNRVSSPAAASPATFRPDDVLNIVPVVKESSPRSMLAEEALEAGRISIAQDQKDLGQELLLESLSLHEQVYGVLHPEVARVYSQLAQLYYNLEEKNAAVELAHKATIVCERTLGVDHHETLLSFLNLGLFEHAIGNTKLALSYVRHALDLWKLLYGPKHPDSVTTINNAAVMLQSLKLYKESRIWFEACLTISEEVSGRQSIGTATLLFQLSQALVLDHDWHAAVNRMREAYNIFNNTLGASHANTKEAETWLTQLTQNAVNEAKRLQAQKDLLTRKGTGRGKIPLTNKVGLGAARPQPPVGQTPAQMAGREAEPKMDTRSIEELLRYIEGDSGKKPTTPKKRPANPKRRAQKA